MALLVKFSKDWADEFDVNGFKIFNTDEEWNEFFEELTNSEGEYYFGTNEFWDYTEFQHDDFEVVYVDFEVTKNLEILFGREWGVFPEPGLDEDDVY